MLDGLEMERGWLMHELGYFVDSKGDFRLSKEKVLTTFSQDRGRLLSTMVVTCILSDIG
jgi:hypothetical protein